MTLKSILAAFIIAMVMMTGNAFAGDKININTATIEQLQQLKGIGEKTAAAIVAYRDAHGAFKSVEGLLGVKGIGEKKLDNIDDELIVE